MGLDVKAYNQQFLEKVKQKEPVYNDASAKYKVDIKFLSEIDVPDDATLYWRVVGIHHLTGAENMGNITSIVMCSTKRERRQRRRSPQASARAAGPRSRRGFCWAMSRSRRT